ncbi:hypothetical protein [Streptomyces sp. NPDC057580]|uniref:hypothetical protein n=1 Tax=Streptomyces sp. NPDC057580 TaxID=3346173 RepID=UPI0036AEED69
MSYETDRAFWGDETPLPPTTTDQERRAAVRAADYVAAQHPHPADDTMPHFAGRELAMNPLVHVGLRELLDALGLNRGNCNV